MPHVFPGLLCAMGYHGRMESDLCPQSSQEEDWSIASCYISVGISAMILTPHCAF